MIKIDVTMFGAFFGHLLFEINTFLDTFNPIEHIFFKIFDPTIDIIGIRVIEVLSSGNQNSARSLLF